MGVLLALLDFNVQCGAVVEDNAEKENLVILKGVCLRLRVNTTIIAASSEMIQHRRPYP